MTPLYDTASVTCESTAANFRPPFESTAQAVRQLVLLLRAHGSVGVALTGGHVGLKIRLAAARVCGR